MTISAINMRTGAEAVYLGLTPRDAVIAAHAQERGDWNTWNYSARHGGDVRHGRHFVFCGDWAARLPKGATDAVCGVLEPCAS